MSSAILERGYFTSEESEMAAKWKMFEDYKALMSKLSVLEREANTAALALQDIAQVLGGAGRDFKIVSEKVIRVPFASTSGLQSRDIDLSKLDPDRLLALLSDIESTGNQKAELAKKLRDLGMSLP
jgi:uncharacterized protein (UPF0335 family)